MRVVKSEDEDLLMGHEIHAKGGGSILQKRNKLGQVPREHSHVESARLHEACLGGRGAGRECKGSERGRPLWVVTERCAEHDGYAGLHVWSDVEPHTLVQGGALGFGSVSTEVVTIGETGRRRLLVPSLQLVNCFKIKN